MKNRIGTWASAGFLVASFWAVFFLLYPRTFPIERITWTLAVISQPIALAGFYFHIGLRWYVVVLANAATYALLGLMVETMRRRAPAK